MEVIEKNIVFEGFKKGSDMIKTMFKALHG